MLHFLVVGILVIVTAILAYFGVNILWPLPEPASAQAMPIDWMWNLQMIAMSFLFALIVVPMLYSLIVFRRKKGDSSEGAHIEGNTRLEITWTVLPLIAVLTFAYLGASTLAETRRVDPDATIVKVTGSQWSWKFEYPATGVVSDQLHIPVGKQVLLQMTSSDVIHSFWVPEFRVKQDLLPGRTTELRITPTIIGSYKVRCAELCGTSHAFMEKPVIVTSQADYEAWMTEQVALAAALDTPEGRGQALVTTSGCAGCHSINGTKMVGPTWLGLAGSQVQLSDGSTITADDAFLAESILNPQARIVAGFENKQMVPFSFTDQQIADIIAYIKTLK